MFSGIIEAIGAIRAVDSGVESSQVAFSYPEGFGPLEMGESVAVDGACLTVSELSQDGFGAIASAETLSRTTLGQRRVGDKVNLERALALGGRLGGHMVSGHVDARGAIRSLEARENSWDLAVEAPAEILRLCVLKGSIAVDGISLTISALEEWGFCCAIIPHTYGATTLGLRRPGDALNLESDLIGKYIERLVGPRSSAAPSAVTYEKLEQAGFL